MSIIKERAYLLNELVRKLVSPLHPDGHPKRAAVERLVKNGISFHTFLDTYPDVVEAEWSEIVERLEINAQFDKARVLAALTKLLLSTQEPSIQRDYPYRVLSFLIASSRNISGSFVDDDASQMVLRISSKDELVEVVDDPTESAEETLQEDSDDDWWRMHISYDSGDTLSEWSQDLWSKEEELEKGADIDSSEDVEDDSSFLCEDFLARRPLPARRPFVHRQNNSRGQRYQDIENSRSIESPYDPNSLTVWLAAQLSGGNPAQHLEPRLCFKEQNLVQQILKMFQGVSSPGPSFCFDTSTGSYKAVGGVHTSQCSPFVLQPLLEMFAEISTRMNRIDAHCTDIIKSCSGLGSRLEIANYPTVVSCAAALNQHIRHFRNGYFGSDIPSLLSLYVQMCGTWKHYVCFIDEHVLPFLQASAPHSAASFSCSLLNALHTAIKRFGMLSGATGGVLVSQLMDLLCNAIKPTLDAVQDWLTSGSLENAPPEFFIKERTREMGVGQSIDTRVSSNWEGRYRLEMDETSGEVAVPGLLKPLASSILSTGAVAAAMTQTVKTENASWERSSAVSLFTSFCNAVQTDIVKHASFTTAPVTSKEEKNNRGVCDVRLQSETTSSQRCILDWTAASSRAATGDLSIQSVCVLDNDDLKDLAMRPASILELEAAQIICPPETALYYVDKCIHSVNDHPISHAMLASFWSKLHDLHGKEQPCFSNIREDTILPKESSLESSEAVKTAEQQHSVALGDAGGHIHPTVPAWDGSSGWSEWYHRTVQALCVQDMRPSTNAAGKDCFVSEGSVYATTVLPHKQRPVLWSSAPPADFVVKRAIEAVLSVYMQKISQTACQKVLHAGLVSQLSVMRSFVLFSFPAVANFVNVFVLQSSTPQGVGGVSLIDANGALELAIASCEASVRTFQDFSILGVDVDGQGECEPSSSIPSYVEGFQRLQINMQLKWPVSMFMKEGMVQVYKKLMILTLQLEWCRQSLLAMHPVTGGYFGRYCDQNHRHLDVPRNGGTLSKSGLTLVIHDMLHFVLCLQNHLAWVVDAAAIAFESQLSQSCTSIQDISTECNAFTTRIAEAHRGVSDSTLSLSPLLNTIIHVCSSLGKLAHYYEIEGTKDEEVEQEIEKLERETLTTINEYTRRKRNYLHLLLQLRAESIIANESAKQFLFIFDPTGRYSFV